MNIKYTKINGNGNNFLILNNIQSEFDDLEKSKLTIRDCNPKKSIGADGIIFVEKSNTADFCMRIFNSDGSEAQMCGNGARCIAKYAFDAGIAGSEMEFETGAGNIKAQIINQSMVSIEMETIDITKLKIRNSLEIFGKKIIYDYLPVGVPHVCIYCKENQIHTREDIVFYGNAINKNKKIFPSGTNVNFVDVIKKDTIKVNTFERGIDDITDSCGTGSCSAAVINALKNKIFEGTTKVINPGGINIVEHKIDNINNICKIKLSGEVTSVGEIKMFK